MGEFMVEAVARDSRKIFMEIAGQSISYGEFYSQAKRAARLFLDLGISRGDRVCLFLPNCPEFHFCWFGLSIIGAISVPVNTAYKRDETAYILNNAEATALVAHSSLLAVGTEAADLATSV